MSFFSDLAELLPDAATELGRAARGALEGAAGEVSRLLRPERFKPMLSELRYGPIVPEPYRFGVDFTRDAFLLASAYSAGSSAYRVDGLQPLTVGLVGLQAALHLNPSGYRLVDVGLNARRVLQYREAYRFLSAPVIHSTLPHLAGNLAGLMAEGSELERRVGSAAMLGTVASIGALSQGFYVAGCWTAAKLSSSPTLYQPYYQAYALGFSGILFGLQALVGYLREAERGGLVEEEYPYTHGRYRCWLSLGLTHFFVPGASLAGHISGIAAGLAHIYLPQAWAALWRRLTGRRPPMRLRAGSLVQHRTRWWQDLLGHLLLGGGTAAIVLMRRRSNAGGGAR